MCVIAVVDNSKFRPSLEDLQAMEITNPDGGGIAWIDGHYVIWKKSISSAEIAEIQHRITPPYIIHFRLASIGGKSPMLCHPFPVTKEVGTDLKGKIKGKVLFHNGHWREWKKICLDIVIRSGHKFIKKPHSDTRAIAWLASIYGTDMLSLLNEKIAILSPDGVEIFGDDWENYKGYVVSNIYWIGMNRHKYWWQDIWK